MKRLQHIDALRGFALLLILLLHAHSKFALPVEPSQEFLQLDSLDNLASRFVYFLIRNKAFAIFSLMFGFSFFLQTDRSSKTDSGFRAFFAWRLFILLIIGYINAVVFRSDILTKYAFMGFVILLLYRFNTRIIAGLAFLMLLQIPDLVRIFGSLGDMSYQVPDYSNTELWKEIYSTSAEGSFLQLVKLNARAAFFEIWKLNFTSGRILQILGYFLIGLLLGRSRLLEDIKNNLRSFLILITGSSVFYLGIRFARMKINNSDWIPEQSASLIDALFTSYMNFFMVIVIISMFVLLYQTSVVRPLLDILAPYGRMSLTSYIAQGFIGVILFYGFGFGLHKYLGTFLSLSLGFVILFVLLIFSHIWLRYFRYGPVEWLWRAMAFRTRDIPMRKVN